MKTLELKIVRSEFGARYTAGKLGVEKEEVEAILAEYRNQGKKGYKK